MRDIAYSSYLPVNHFGTQVNSLEDSHEIEQRAIKSLESHPHFRGRNFWVQCSYSRPQLYLTGKVPSYYLKQLAQEAVRDVAGVDVVVNRIVVASHMLPVTDPGQGIDKSSLNSGDSRHMKA